VAIVADRDRSPTLQATVGKTPARRHGPVWSPAMEQPLSLRCGIVTKSGHYRAVGFRMAARSSRLVFRDRGHSWDDGLSEAGLPGVWPGTVRQRHGEPKRAYSGCRCPVWQCFRIRQLSSGWPQHFTAVDCSRFIGAHRSISRAFGGTYASKGLSWRSRRVHGRPSNALLCGRAEDPSFRQTPVSAAAGSTPIATWHSSTS